MVSEEQDIHVFWLEGMGCDGCSVSALTATTPALEDLARNVIPGVPGIVLHHPMLGEDAGPAFLEPYARAAAGQLGAPYVLVVEGSIPDDQFIDRGAFATLGARSDRPVKVTDWVIALAPGAAACIAIGTCATWGGIPAAAGNITGSMGLMDFLGLDYRSQRDIPVVNVPGCAPVGDNFTETLKELLRHLDGTMPLPEFDELGRPAWQFGETVHRHCMKAGYYEEGVFAEEPGDDQCLVEIGCWGPVVQCNITERGAFKHMGGCMIAGGACIGCTMPGFPDKYSPFYKAPPGSAFSGSVSKVYGGGIRRLRRLSMSVGNREPIWDRADDVPSAWARHRGGADPIERANAFFYKKIQYRGSVNQSKRNKKQPQPKSLDILVQKGVDMDASVPVLGERVVQREDL